MHLSNKSRAVIKRARHCLGPFGLEKDGRSNKGRSFPIICLLHFNPGALSFLVGYKRPIANGEIAKMFKIQLLQLFGCLKFRDHHDGADEHRRVDLPNKVHEYHMFICVNVCERVVSLSILTCANLDGLEQGFTNIVWQWPFFGCRLQVTHCKRRSSVCKPIGKHDEVPFAGAQVPEVLCIKVASVHKQYSNPLHSYPKTTMAFRHDSLRAH